MNNMETTDYQKQARDFLEKHGIAIRISLSDTKPAPWSKDKDEDRHHFRVTLSKKNPGQVSYRLTFDFWDSIHNFEEGKEPTPYDVLACISSDAYCSESFEDFCAEMGMDTDSISALQTYRRCSSFSKRLKAFFTEQELTELGEIQ